MGIKRARRGRVRVNKQRRDVTFPRCVSHLRIRADMHIPSQDANEPRLCNSELLHEKKIKKNFIHDFSVFFNVCERNVFPP